MSYCLRQVVGTIASRSAAGIVRLDGLGHVDVDLLLELSVPDDATRDGERVHVVVA
jgi:hypothetical protein